MGELNVQNKEKKMDHNNDYENGLRDGRLLSLETTVKDLMEDFKKLKIAIYMLYGAIALVQFMPYLKGFLSHGATP